MREQDKWGKTRYLKENETRKIKNERPRRKQDKQETISETKLESYSNNASVHVTHTTGSPT